MNSKKNIEAFCTVTEHYFNLDEEYILINYLEHAGDASDMVEIFAKNWIKKDYPENDNYKYYHQRVIDLSKRNEKYLPILVDPILNYANTNDGKKLSFLEYFPRQELQTYLISTKNKKGVEKMKRNLIVDYLKQHELNYQTDKK